MRIERPPLTGGDQGQESHIGPRKLLPSPSSASAQVPPEASSMASWSWDEPPEPGQAPFLQPQTSVLTHSESSGMKGRQGFRVQGAATNLPQGAAFGRVDWLGTAGSSRGLPKPPADDVRPLIALWGPETASPPALLPQQPALAVRRGPSWTKCSMGSHTLSSAAGL